MSDNDKLVILYDYYGELFTEQQKRCFEGYYFENLSLSEIADIEDKSRNAIHKQIVNVCEKLTYYEENIKLLEKIKRIENVISSLDEKIKENIKNILYNEEGN